MLLTFLERGLVIDVYDWGRISVGASLRYRWRLRFQNLEVLLRIDCVDDTVSGFSLISLLIFG